MVDPFASCSFQPRVPFEGAFSGNIPAFTGQGKLIQTLATPQGSIVRYTGQSRHGRAFVNSRLIELLNLADET